MMVDIDSQLKLVARMSSQQYRDKERGFMAACLPEMAQRG